MATKKMDIHQIAGMGLLTALAYAAVLLTKVLLPVQFGGFLTYEPKDCILAIGAFLYGPIAGLSMTVVVSVIEMVTVSTTGLYGLLMNVVASALFVCPAALFYAHRRTLSGAVIGLVSGTLLMTAGMIGWNYIITPLYLGMPRQAVVELLVPLILPFNLLKGGVNAALTMLLYKAVAKALRKTGLYPASVHEDKRRLTVLISALVLALLVLLVLVWQKII